MATDLRCDRLISLYLFSPLRHIRRDGYRSIPVLMYHSIGVEDESATRPYYRIVTPPTVFRSQMELLRRSGFKTCDLGEALSFLQSREDDVSGLVVITFDDGYRDFHREAFPVLDEFGFSATVFLPTRFVGHTPQQLNGRECLTWCDVRELQKQGIMFGSHTVSHPQLRGLGKESIYREIADSKMTIEDEIGVAVHSFAYPYAFPQADSGFTQMLGDLLGYAGYRNGVCTTVGRAGRNSDPYFLARLPINGADDNSLFEAKLTGAYDWIGHCQSLSKRTRALLSSQGGWQ